LESSNMDGSLVKEVRATLTDDCLVCGETVRVSTETGMVKIGRYDESGIVGQR
jgi:hypothetical protein